MKRAEKKPIHILPSDPANAVRAIFLITRKLCDFADQEANALAMGDMMRFAYTQQDKEKITEEYAKASEEFRQRVEAFRNVDKSLLNELEKVQKELKKKSEQNNLTIGQIRDRALSNTKGTLFAAQEMGQRVKFNGQSPANNQRGA